METINYFETDNIETKINKNESNSSLDSLETKEFTIKDNGKSILNDNQTDYIKSLSNKDHISMGDVKRISGLDEQTLRKLFDSGVISGYRIENLKNKRMFSKQSVLEYCNLVKTVDDKSNRYNYIYIRAKNKEDAKYQEDMIRSRLPNTVNYIKIMDICKNMTHNKRGLQRLLSDCTRQKINTVVIAHNDIFGKLYYNIINEIIDLSGGTVNSLNMNEFKESEEVIISDIYKMIHNITMNSTCKRKNKKKKNCDDDDVEDDEAED